MMYIVWIMGIFDGILTTVATYVAFKILQAKRR